MHCSLQPLALCTVRIGAADSASGQMGASAVAQSLSAHVQVGDHVLSASQPTHGPETKLDRKTPLATKPQKRTPRVAL